MFLLVLLLCLISSTLSSNHYGKSLIEGENYKDEIQDSSEETKGMFAKRSPSHSSIQLKNSKRVTPDEKLQKMTFAFIKYVQLLRSNQLDSNIKKVIVLQLNDLVEEMQRHLAENPELEHSIIKMIKSPSIMINGDATDDAKSKDVTPFKWGK